MYAVQPSTGFGQEQPKFQLAPKVREQLTRVTGTVQPMLMPLATTPPPWSIPVEEEKGLPTWAWAVIGGGGALIIGAALIFALRKRKARRAEAGEAA